MLFWALTIALGLVIAGLILIWFSDRFAGGRRREMARLAASVERLESRLNLHFQATGNYQEWARLGERDRELFRDE